MPLIKRTQVQPGDVPTQTATTMTQDNASRQLGTQLAPRVATEAQGGTVALAAKRLGSTHKAGDKANSPMTKDDYWRRREENDVARDTRISRAGMYQAALQSVGILQLNTGNTLDDYLKLVEQVVERGLQFVHRA